MTVLKSSRRILTLSLTVTLTALLFSQTQGVDILLGKARSLEARGRMDLAAQNWKQVLMANPRQTEALAGLARYAKENGNTDEERAYLDRLRKINPADPAIAETEKMKVVTPEERGRLEEAGRLNMRAKPDEAMKIYRDVFGDNPPPGKWAAAYYEAETVSNTGRPIAIAQLRQLCSRNPKNEVYRFWLARALSYDPKTRLEAFRLLESIKDPGAAEQARASWRQALLWEKDNPNVQAFLETYLHRYPDAELERILIPFHEKQQEEAANAAEKRGYDALHNDNLAAAQTLFEQALRNSPKDAGATAGMGFVRLKQQNFDEALRWFDQARALAPQRHDIQEGYDNAKFLGIIDRASTALQHNEFDLAANTYQEALALRPWAPDALLGLGQARMRAGNLAEAKETFEKVLAQSANNVDAMAGLGLIALGQHDFPQAVNWFEQVQKLAPNRTDIREPYATARYWAVMQQGAAALKQNHPDVAISSYQQALTLRPGTKESLLGMAHALDDKKDYAGAGRFYSQLTAADPADAEAWQGLIRAQRNANDIQAALNTAHRLPPQVTYQLERHSEYWSELALLYYQSNQPDEAAAALARAFDTAARSDPEDASDLRLQIAGVLMDQGKLAPAVGVYKKETALHPDKVTAWEGLIGAYARLRNFTEAAEALRHMPKESYAAAGRSPGFLNAVASIYSAQGRCEEAEDFLNRAINLDQALGHRPPVDTEMQLADLWMREGQYQKAAEKYHEILATNSGRSDAWRGLVTALHAVKLDQKASAEMRAAPAGIRAELEKDPEFLSLLVGVELGLNHRAQAAQLLRRARSTYESAGQMPPANLDVQLAWLLRDMPGNEAELARLLSQSNARKDLTAQQKDAIHSIWASWSVQRATAALENHRPKDSETILLDAARVMPRDPQLRAALSAVYMRQHEYPKALDIYLTWGMTGAQAADYRAAAGAALAAHKDTMAKQFLQEGLQRWPHDPELLRMYAKREAAEGDYKEAEQDLKTSLSALRSANSSNARNATEENSASETSKPAGPIPSTRSLGGLSASQPIEPSCRPGTGGAEPQARLEPIALAWFEPADATEPQDQQVGSTDSIREVPIDSITEKQTQDEIDIIKNRNTPFISLDNLTGGRTGDPGFDRLIIQDGGLGQWVNIQDKVRLGFEAHGVYLFSGTPSGGSTKLFGTLPQGATFGEQSEAGYAGQVQLSTNDFGLMFGVSPQGFPIHNLVGGARLRPGHGPVTFMFLRDNVKDSLLSYAGVRDPGSGIVWGGVISNAGSVQLKWDTRRAGVYALFRYSDLRGQNVPDNSSLDGNAGLYFNLVRKPLVGFALGLNVGGMHYDKNLNFFSFGQGGYFSPQEYYQASIPLSVSGGRNRFQYELVASGGVQHFLEDRSPIYPVQAGAALLPASFYSSEVHTGPNYNATFRTNYRVTDHVNFGLFASANNSRNFATQALGFSLKFLFHRVPTDPDLRVHSIPDWKGEPPFDLRP